jgi:poly-gamma-glutamate synthesis protein (capsule biosynthesis protein)
VGNQAGGAAHQPDYDAQARALRDRVAPDLPRQLPGTEEACHQMVDAVARAYAEAEGEGAHSVAMLERTRQADLRGCVERTSAAAALCVARLVAAQEGEYPFLLDQCSRAFPREAAKRGTLGDRGRATSIGLAFVGDVIFGRYRDGGYDPIAEDGFAVFSEVRPLLEADLTIGNLETPLVRELPQQSPIGARFRFGASMTHARQLVDAGFSVMSLANNHWFDMRSEGAEQTPILLRELGIVPVGEASMEGPLFVVRTLQSKGWTIGFVAFTNRTNAPLREGLPQAPYLETRDVEKTIGPVIEAARAGHDVIVVLVHWGDEYADHPNIAQTRAAHALVDAGADLVIGHHPHVLQGMQRYRSKLIAYSLGNFLFENTNDPPRLTGVLHVRLREPHVLESILFQPAVIVRTPVPHPVPATKTFRKRVVERMRRLSERFGTDWKDDERGLELAL